jgi:uncharacterized protein (TIGR04141 family)
MSQLLNAFLLKRSIEPVSAISALPEGADLKIAILDKDGWSELSPSEAGVTLAAIPGDMFAVLISRSRSAPSWHYFLHREIDIFSFEDQAPSYGAIIFCATCMVNSNETRWLAWCFGTGARMLRRSSQDPRFGLNAALNLVSAPKETSATSNGGSSAGSRRELPQFREVSYRTTSPSFQHTGQRSARNIPVDAFRIDKASDLIASIGGQAGSDDFARSFRGGRSMQFQSDVKELQELSSISAKLVELSYSKNYASELPWVDNIQIVEDEAICLTLRRQLLADLGGASVPPTVDAILPDDLLDVDDERSIGYILYPREKKSGVCRRNLPIEAIAARLRGASDPDRMLNDELRFTDEVGEVLGKARLLDCICADLTLGGKQYILYDGDFYKVDRSFVDRIDTELMQLENSAISFPDYGGETEPKYIDMVKDDHSDSFIVLDRQLIKLEGEYGIEACDLVAKSGALVHLKRKGKSSTLSHLFLQASNGCELLRRSLDARRQLGQLIQERAECQILASQVEQVHNARLSGNGLEVVFGFLGDWRERPITSLPLFSRISLVYESRKVSGLGFKPTVALIG